MPVKDLDADLIRVRHMADACREALGFCENKTKHDLATNRMFALALIKELEIIGEAASKVSEDFRIKHSKIPWTAIVGARNRLVHGYQAIDFDIVWETVEKVLPSLLQLLETILVTASKL